MDQELLQEAAGLHQEVEQLEKHCSVLDNEIIELSRFREELDMIENSKDKEVLASIGKGVFAPAKITKDTFFVEVGAGIVVKKDPVDVKKIIETQIENMQRSKTLFNQELEMKFSDLQEIIKRLENKEKR